MTNLAKSIAAHTQADAKSAIVISEISIRQDSEGRYSLNDLHKAAGNESRHAPAQWLRLEQVGELINTILNMQICTIKPVDSYKGRYGGTYVCKELVYAYATWISAEFFLKVIRAYDALVSGDAEKAVSIAKTTVDDRTPLRSLVNRIMAKYGTTYQSVYRLIHREFGVKHIDELSPKQTTEAMEYLATKAIEGEFIGKQTLPAPARLNINYPGNWWLQNSIAAQKENAWAESDGVINMSLMVLKRKEESVLGRILFELRNSGYNVDAGYIELDAMKHHLQLLTRLAEAMQDKSYQAIHRGFHTKM